MNVYPVYAEPAPAVVAFAPPVPMAVVQNPAPVVMKQPLKSTPCRMRCKFCDQEIVTVIKPVRGVLAWVVFGILFFCFLWPFCLIPLFVKTCKDVEHSCPSCANVLHVHKRM